MDATDGMKVRRKFNLYSVWYVASEYFSIRRDGLSELN